jgi:hypothetical protein
VQKYIQRIIPENNKPKKILVCMYYYLDKNPTPSWAGCALGCLGYNRTPHKLQTLIRRAFEEATTKIQIPGSQVVPVPLFNVLDGENSRDYVARVEPSSQGGRKMAEYLLDVIYQGGTANGVGSAPVESTYMADRS